MSERARFESRRRLRRYPGRMLACLPIAAGLALTPAVAMADGPGHYYSDVYKITDDGDSGGSSGSVTVHPDGEFRPLYAIQFQAKGEHLYVKDFQNLDRRLEAYVFVWDKSGDLVDRDVFTTSASDREYNLGTPDGSGNIPDGYRVAIRIEPEGGDYWSDLAAYTA